MTPTKTRGHARRRPAWARRQVIPADDHVEPADSGASEIVVTFLGSGPRYLSKEGDFAVWTAALESEADRPVTVKGPLGRCTPGERARCRGRWQKHPQRGWSFQVTDYRSGLPSSDKGIAAWLEHRVPGVGPAFASAIVEHFGTDRVFRILDEDPGRLREVKTAKGRSISSKQVEKAIAAWGEVRVLRGIETFLFTHGVSASLADKLYRRYGEAVIEILETDPYRITELRGVGFLTADKIARDIGVPLDDPKRLQAGIIFLLESAEGGSGHSYLYLSELLRSAGDILGVKDDFLIAAQVGEVAKSRRIVIEQDAPDSEQRIYLRRLHDLEVSLAERVRDMLTPPSKALFLLPPRPTPDPGLSEDEILSLRLPSDEQWGVLDLVRKHRLSILTGSPGTGKTTSIVILCEAAQRYGLALRLAAPTGKAARRLTEVTGQPASTVHRLLEYSPFEDRFQRDAGNPIDCDLIICDEASMLSLELASALLEAIGPRTHLLLVGDADQLPPVGAGKVFHDLIDSRLADGRPAVPHIHLTRIFRQAEKSMIIRNAVLVNEGKMPILDYEEALALWGEEMHRDFFFLGASSYERALAVTIEMVCERIPRIYGFDPKSEIMTMAPIRKGPLGLDALNRVLEKKLNPGLGGREPPLLIPSRGIRLGSRVMQTENDYTPGREIMNGDLGIVKQYNAEEKEILLHLEDGREVWMPIVNCDNLILANAISVHKAQGSEFPCVVFICSTAHYMLLSRALLYTAISRAKQLCVVIGHSQNNPRGPRAAIMDSVRNAEMQKRNSLLAARIANPLLSGQLL